MREWLGMLVLVPSCARQDDRASQTETSDPTPFVAMVSTSNPTVVIAYTAQANQARLSDVTAGKVPTDFRWVSVAAPANALTAIRSESGLQVDLTDASGGLTFSQVYVGPCNPAKDNYDNCLLYETYKSGDESLTGTVKLSWSNGDVLGSFDVNWEGMTNRFGDPVQWHKHGTLSSYQATLVTGGSQ